MFFQSQSDEHYVGTGGRVETRVNKRFYHFQNSVGMTIFQCSSLRDFYLFCILKPRIPPTATYGATECLYLRYFIVKNPFFDVFL